MQYITRKEATNKHKVSFVTLDKYLRLGKIHTRKVKGGGILIDQEGLARYIELKQQMGVVFENKTLFDDTTNTTSKETSVGETVRETEGGKETNLAIIGGYQSIIKEKDDLLEQKSNKLVKQEKQTRLWSNAFFFILALFLAGLCFAYLYYKQAK